MGTNNLSGIETPEASAETPEAAAVAPVDPSERVDNPEAAVSSPPTHVDRVAAVSYRADGTPDQTDGFVVIAED